MNNTYTFSTPEHSFSIRPVENSLVRVESERKEGLEELVDSIELAGVADNSHDYLPIEIESSEDELGTYYFIEISKPTLSIYLTFEVLNYMGVSIA